jgi:hypothetical protein
MRTSPIAAFKLFLREMRKSVADTERDNNDATSNHRNI